MWLILAAVNVLISYTSASLLKKPILFMIVLFPIFLVAQESSKIRLNDTLEVNTMPLFSEMFESPSDNWVVEQQPGGTVSFAGGRLEIDDVKGCTIWFKQLLNQPVIIEYTATVIDQGGPNDRVSDLNCFWLATDPHRDNFFSNPSRQGRFPQYDTLQLYYVGLGGHNNTKTRFRKYAGTGEKPLLPEHDLSDPKFLISPNQANHIRIVAYHSLIQYWRNNQLIYSVLDPNPYTRGYFGFRTVNNHMTVDDFMVYSIRESQ